MVLDKKFLGIVLFTLFFIGCSSRAEVPSFRFITLTVETPNCPSATCRIDNTEGIYYLDTPGSITIPKSESNSEVVCYIIGGSPESLVVSPGVNFVSHPLNCPETKEEIKLKEDYLKQEEAKQQEEEEDIILEEVSEDASQEIDAPTQALLDKLEELLNQGLISLSAYEKERKVILKD